MKNNYNELDDFSDVQFVPGWKPETKAEMGGKFIGLLVIMGLIVVAAVAAS